MESTCCPIPDGLEVFPPGTRISDDSWATVSAKGEVVCPDNCGAWRGMVRWNKKANEYRMTFPGHSNAPKFVTVVPYTKEPLPDEGKTERSGCDMDRGVAMIKRPAIRREHHQLAIAFRRLMRQGPKNNDGVTRHYEWHDGVWAAAQAVADVLRIDRQEFLRRAVLGTTDRLSQDVE